jgi:class 3 adenylate cyclase
MVVFASARRALECAMAVQQTPAAYNAENPGEPIRVRVALHPGEAIKEGEDFFGKSVILAARIAPQAKGGQILVSSLLKALVASRGEFQFSSVVIEPVCSPESTVVPRIPKTERTTTVSTSRPPP